LNRLEHPRHHTAVLRKPLVFLAFVAVVTAVACRSTTDTAVPAAQRGVDVEAMDRSVKPGDDFYKFANGTWIARTRSRPIARGGARAPSSPSGPTRASPI
jgi:hypothetical protein